MEKIITFNFYFVNHFKYVVFFWIKEFLFFFIDLKRKKDYTFKYAKFEQSLGLYCFSMLVKK